MNEKGFNWDDLRAFLAVARSGGLSGATKTFGGSPATLGRRVQALEDSLKEKLFERHSDGYRLTAKGDELLAHAEMVEQNIFSIERWQEAHNTKRSVRISAGSWTSLFLMENFSQLHRKNDEFQLQFLSTEARLSIAHRKADIGIRNSRPTEIGLAGKALGEVTFAAYRHKDAEQELPWVVPSSQTPSGQWVRQNLKDELLTEVSHPRNALDLVELGVAQGVFPCFIGDAKADLIRASDIIGDLTHTHWIAMHEEDRFSGAIRTVLRRLENAITEKRELFEGKLGFS